MGNLTKRERMANYRDVLFEINDLFTNTLQLEWAPKGGTLIHPSEEHFDLENDDIDLFIGAESETHSQHIMLEITERLKRSKFGVFHCFGKSVHPSANFTWRNDLLFCMRKEPVGNLAVAHRLCESESQFTDMPYNCEVHNELVFGGNNLTLDEIYPSEKCLAWNMTLPCPVPEKALKAVMIGGEKGTDAACPYLPTKDRLRKWGEADWTRLLDSMEEIERVGAEMEAKREEEEGVVEGDAAKRFLPRGNIASIKPYVWDEPDCRSLVLQFSTPKIVDRVRACCENVQRGIREKRYEFFAGESAGRKYRKPYSFLKHGKSRSGSLEGAAGSEKKWVGMPQESRAKLTALNGEGAARDEAMAEFKSAWAGARRAGKGQEKNSCAEQDGKLSKAEFQEFTQIHLGNIKNRIGWAPEFSAADSNKIWEAIQALNPEEKDAVDLSGYARYHACMKTVVN
eukprot:g12618.t1